MIVLNAPGNFVRPRLCTWRISTPLDFSNGKSKTQPTPLPFQIYFFRQHNALTISQRAREPKLITLFNIRFIITHIKWVFNHLFISGESAGDRSRAASVARPSTKTTAKSLLGLISAPVVSGTKCSTILTKRLKYN